MQSNIAVYMPRSAWVPTQRITQKDDFQHIPIFQDELQPQDVLRRGSHGRIATVHNPYSFEGPYEVFLEDEIPTIYTEEIPIFSPLQPPLQTIGAPPKQPYPPKEECFHNLHHVTQTLVDPTLLDGAAVANAPNSNESHQPTMSTTPSPTNLSDTHGTPRQPPFLLSSVLLNVSSSWHCHGKRVSSASALRRLRAHVNQEVAAIPPPPCGGSECQTPRTATSPTPSKALPFRERRVRQCLALLRKVPLGESDDLLSNPP
eukprot:GGOE01009958.1.p1 GENE.GGOE01009958.1~~GGOE01009958.1.p1  ORF type:complete len:269 (-),score=23.75 GGOE01009958.1:390-1166(-)